MNMNNVTSRKTLLLEAVKKLGQASYSEISEFLAGDYAERTVKRDLSELVVDGYLTVQGGGRSTVYCLAPLGHFFLPVDADTYVVVPPDKRVGAREQYLFSLWETWPPNLFTQDEVAAFHESTRKYQQRSAQQSPDLQRRELERFVIEMSWKSSQIEGNTYTLLDTELLLKDNQPSKTNSAEETQMIINHKQAFDFVLANEAAFATKLSFGLIETVHQKLMLDLLKDQGLRTGVVGITGSCYQPLDNKHQLREAIEQLLAAISSIDDPFSKALTALLGISYIQPFTDGNKRTARLLANGILLAHDCAPLSYRNVDERTYRASLLVFYEQLSVVPMKGLFAEQYRFSTEHYSSV